MNQNVSANFDFLPEEEKNESFKNFVGSAQTFVKCEDRFGLKYDYCGEIFNRRGGPLS